MSEMIDIGGGTLIAQEKVLAISVYTRSKATQRELRIAEGKGILVDVTRGRKRKSIVITSDYVFLSHLSPERLTPK